MDEGFIFVVRRRVVGEGSKSFLELDVEGGGLWRVLGACALLFAGTLLPFEDTCPVLTLFLVELVFPFGFGFLAILAIVAAFVAA